MTQASNMVFLTR